MSMDVHFLHGGGKPQKEPKWKIIATVVFWVGSFVALLISLRANKACSGSACTCRKNSEGKTLYWDRNCPRHGVTPAADANR